MHRTSHPPELMDAWLPERVGRNARLERLTDLIDWAPLEALVADLHAAPVGRPSYPPLLMVKVLLLQQWYQASDPAMEEALWERLSFRRFVGLGLQDDAPDHSTISRFRTRLTATGLAEPLFAAVARQLAGQGLLVKHGTLLDATVVEAQVRRPRGGDAARPKDPDAAWARRGPPGALRLQAASGRGRRLGVGPAGGADPSQRQRDRGGGCPDRGRRDRGVRGCGLWHPGAPRAAAGAGDQRPADAAAQQTSPAAAPLGAAAPRADRADAAPGGACVWDVEALVRIPPGAVRRAGPEHHRGVVQAPGLQPAAGGPAARRRGGESLGSMRPPPGQARAVGGWRPAGGAPAAHLGPVSGR